MTTTGVGGGLAAVAAVAPDVHARLEGLRALACEQLDAGLVELCQRRLSVLLGVEAEPTAGAELVADQLAELAAWPSSPRFSARERACLAFTEQFAIDVASITDDDVAALAAHLSPAEVYRLVLVLQVFDGRHRLRGALGALLEDA